MFEHLGLKLITLVVLGSARAGALSVVPTRLTPYFGETEFAACLAGSLAKARDAATLYHRLEHIGSRRDASTRVAGSECTELVEAICESSGLSVPSQVKRWLKPIGCIGMKEIKIGLMHHSDGLFDCPASALRPTDGRLYDVLSRWELGETKSGVNVNTVDVVKTALRPAVLADQRRPTELPTEDTACLLYRAQPLIGWLVDQKAGSVSHWRLFARAMEIYGDAFQSLAVIGQMFDTERQLCLSRSKGCLLGNRMRPLFPPESVKYRNPVGDNYHFWAQLNIGLTENGVKNKAAAYALEWLKDGDSGEYSANVVGIDVGAAAVATAREALGRPAVKKPTIDCALGPN